MNPSETFSAAVRDKLIVALDFPTAKDAGNLVRQLGESVHFYKVGFQLFTAEGPSVVRELTSAGKRVFLDLKFHDIPNTVASAVRSACELNVSLLTVHASGGSRMLEAATAAAREKPNAPRIMAVTVLTSMSAEDLTEVGHSNTPREQVLALAGIAKSSKCDGIVASPMEAADIRRYFGEDFVILTGGVRPKGSEAGDQSRIATPAEALKAGVNYLVVGRPITAVVDPAAAAKAILREIASV